MAAAVENAKESHTFVLIIFRGMIFNQVMIPWNIFGFRIYMQ